MSEEPFEPKQTDPSKPQPGESYADYLKRLDDAKKKEEEARDYGSQEYWAGFMDSGRGRSGDPNYGPIPEEYTMNGMSKAAFLCGILSLVTIVFGFSIFFGAFGILFALLSRKKKFGRQARIALWMNGIGVAAFVLTVVLAFYTLISSGIWDTMMKKIRGMDMNDPNAAAVIEQELLDEILNKYGMQMSGSGSQV